MQTIWGDIEVRDAHAHLFSHGFFRVLAAQRGRGESVEALTAELGWREPPEDNRAFAGIWKQELDRHGVARSVLMASVPGDAGSAAEVAAEHPERFYGYFMCDPTARDAAEGVRRAIDSGLQGICLFPAMHRYRIQDERLDPLWSLVAGETNLVVFVHMGILKVGVRSKLGLPSRFDMSCSNPMDLHRVAVDHPEIRFVMPHFGAGYFREALMLGDLVTNVWLDTSSSNAWMRCLVPEITLIDVFRKALEVYGSERLLFGSDSSFFPRGWNREIFDTQAAVLGELGVDAEAAAAIFGRNLQSLLGR
jgi:predicted TIM-barrel fold metal-dependent hydrolase